MFNSKRVLATLSFLTLIFSVSIAEARHAPDVITLNPTTDSGKYLTVHQSKTLPQWGFNAGGTFDYAYEPYERATPAGTRIVGIVDDLMVGNFFGAIGWTDWWTMGINMPIVFWETWYDPNVPIATVTKETKNLKFGDLRVEMKFQLLDIDRYHVGLALVPFMYFPTGYWQTYLGNGMWSPGATLVFDGDIKNRVFLSLNVSYRNYAKTRYDATNANAVIDDTLGLAGAINVRINDDWAVFGEVWSEGVMSSYFKNQLQNPSEFLAGGKYTPQFRSVKGLGITLAGGRAITTGIGDPDFRVLLGINYRYDREPPPPPPAEVEVAVDEKIIITQKIHFEFDRAVIRPISYPILDDVAMLLMQNPQLGLVRVEGHTDWIGSDTYNQQLSERRANSVRNYLINKGIAPQRLQAAGYGESRPIADNNSVKGRARNRRTEFTVVQ
ncbi:MAG: OmpA family protein [Deltaproteobacteria bacterium]|jgi:outer membrane protein OmpA-like peptidoglycan-associated protein|nr:OmpA family protein [Deltaproteobacteria bacterium]